MRALVKDMGWVGLFALAMTGCVAVPIVTAITAVQLLDNNNSGAVPPALLFGSFVFFLSLGLLYVLQHRRRLRERGMPTPVERDEETQLMQELYQRSLKMDRRLEALETLLLGRTEHREHSEY